MGYSLQDYATNYLLPFDNDFWRWSDDGTVIEWFDGQTIAFREEVLDILQHLEEDDFRPFATIVLALAACQENWTMDERADFIQKLIDPSYQHANSHTRPYLKDTFDFMNMIRQLPPELRKGAYKTHLIRNHVLVGEATPGLLQHAMPMVIDLQAGNTHNMGRTCGYDITQRILENILMPFDDALIQTPTVGELESSVRTGVKTLPPAVDPALLPGGLLEALLADPETMGIARLTKYLIAAIKIPIHTAKPAEQLPMGGVADITNRGNFDRLLLTELAQDDALLTARLVNNEALYLRREEPPDETPRQRTILIDTTLRMWGTSRVYATSAALAYSQKADPGTVTTAYALSADHFTKLDLTTRRGVIATLEKLDPALDCIDGLKRFFHNNDTDTDHIFITDADTIIQPEIQLALTELRAYIKFLVTVSRNGQLNVYEYGPGGRKLLSSVTFTLGEILFGEKPAAPAKAKKDLPAATKSKNGVPDFLKEEPCPLYFPAIETTISRKTTYYHPDLGMVSITRTNRLLYWRPNIRLGVAELIHNVAAGTYCFGYHNNTVYLLAYNIPSQNAILYTITLLPTPQTKINELANTAEIVSAKFYETHFLLHRRRGGAMALNALTATVELSSQVPSTSGNTANNANNWKTFANNSCKVLQRADKVWITKSGKLALGQYVITLVEDNIPCLRLIRNTENLNPGTKPAAGTPTVVSFTDNTHVRFQRFEWPNGSTAMIDSRGLLHLKSANTNLSELTIVLILGENISAWAADGSRTGDFVIERHQYVNAQLFHKLYIQKFIDSL